MYCKLFWVHLLLGLASLDNSREAVGLVRRSAWIYTTVSLASSTLEEFENQTITSYFGFVCKKNHAGNSHDNLDLTCTSFTESSVFKTFSIHLKTTGACGSIFLLGFTVLLITLMSVERWLHLSLWYYVVMFWKMRVGNTKITFIALSFLSADNAKFGLVTLLLCRGRSRNVPRIITHVHSHRSVHECSFVR